MKNTIRIALLTVAISSLLSGGSIFAESADKPATASGKQEYAGVEPKKCERWEEKEKRLEKLKSELKLNANQEAAWTVWFGTINGDRKAWKEMRENEGSWADLSVPERMEKKLAFSKKHIARQEARLAATKTFYATLSSEQRKIFDKGYSIEHHGNFATMKGITVLP